MSETGIVRRIDELGRVVIPKEMRKTLRIKEGDPLEIYANREELIFKKYSPIATVEGYAKIVAEGISQLTDKTCVVTDTDKVVYVSSSRYKDIVGEHLSKGVENVLKNRKGVVFDKRGGNLLPLVPNDFTDAENQIIVPIVANGDCLGSVILFDREKTQRLGTKDLQLVELGATFLSKQLET